MRPQSPANAADPPETAPETAPETRRAAEQMTRADQRKLAEAVMQKQAALSIRIAAGFLALILALPLINAFVPQVAFAPVAGFTLTWLFLAVLFYPITWLLSGYFIKASDRIEAECAAYSREFVAEHEQAGEGGAAR